ncbi:MAG: leucine-rich repeat protein [Bacteroidaceae bacterium]|nr:leucine-rich repeat protein [Bacteroidaceae bacterium]
MHRLIVAALFCLMQGSAWALTEINVETAGTLQSLLTSTDQELKVTGVINGSDIKYIRQLVTAGTVKKLDWSGVRIVSGGQAYFESYTTQDNVVGEKMFYECSNLQQMLLPTTVTSILKNAFARTRLSTIDIPSSVRTIGEDAFAYCNSLSTVVIGQRVNQLSKGSFYGSAVTKAYVKPITPPAPPSYLFSSTPKIYVYSDALQDYKDVGWNEYGTLYGTLENFYPQEPGEDDIVSDLCSNFFQDAACTQLKAEYGSMSDEELAAAFAEAGMPDYMLSIALKVKNGTWANYEQEFRIHSYQPYSDAKSWNDKLWARCASYMGNPTGIYAQSYQEPLYVFVDDDVPADATLYIAGIGVDDMFTTGKAGHKLKKGLNIVDADADKYYYILYTVDTKSLTKRVSEWPDIKIHIEGGKLEGYFDAARHTDADYKKLLNAATYTTFVAKGKHSVMNIRTSRLRETYSSKIAKAVECLDSLSVWEKDLFGISEAVANGEKAGAPYYLTGGDAFYPGYFNNPTYVDNDSPGSVAHSTEFGIHISLDASKSFLNPYVASYDESGTAHELGHQLQSPIMLEGTTEGSNDLFSNYCRFFMGHKSSMGNPLSVTMQEFAHNVPFYWRGADKGFIRMYYSLYLYYHQAQKNTSFYPELFKALRADKIQPYGTSTSKSGLKFVRKVCEVAQEDLTDFFTVYGFFEPATNRYLECYGDHYVTNRLSEINSTKRSIAQYEKKNREIIFIEDRVEHVPPTNFIPRNGTNREYRKGEAVGQCGDVGQFTSYLPNASAPADYVYYSVDSLYSMVGTGGVGFLMLDEDGTIRYASNAFDVCIPTSIGRDFSIYAVDADGTLHEVARAGSGTETVELDAAGRLQTTLQNEDVIKLIVKGKIHGKDIKYLRELIANHHLQAIDLDEAQIITNNTYSYYQSYKTTKNVMGPYAFQDFRKLIAMRLPQDITSIGTNAFSGSGLKSIAIPDKVTSIGEDAFAYCSDLTTVLVGKKVTSISKGAFYDSNVKDIYVAPLTPPSVSSYLLSSNPLIHVYPSVVAAYQASSWAEYGTIVGDLTDDIVDGVELLPEVEKVGVHSSKSNEVYDLMGRRVTNLKPGCIYIRNGKTFMVK